MKEHQRDVRLKYVTQSAEHSIESEHQILFGKTTSYNGIIFSKEVQGNCRNTETNNLNRDMRYNISKIWKIAISPLSSSQTPLEKGLST